MLPKMIYQCIFLRKYRQSLWQRCGYGFPMIEKEDRPLIWLHAVSVGEIKAAARLINELQKKLDAVLVVSSTTETGHAAAKSAVPQADFHVYMPFDFYAMITPIVARVKPDYVLISESDLWFHFLRAAKKEGAFVALINGKISARSAMRLAKVPFFTKPLFAAVDLLCVQSELYEKRFQQLHISPQKMQVTGNLKFDAAPERMSEEDKKQFKAELSIPLENHVLVIGSSHDPEEKALLQIFKKIRAQIPRLQLILVPRHPERFDSVAAQLCEHDIPFYRYLEPSRGGPRPVILIDCMGLLEKCYQIADLAIVAGSYTAKVGGHNILEPLWFDVPVVFGPHMASQPELLDVVQHYGAGKQLPLELLEQNIPLLLNDLVLRSRLKAGGKQLISEMHGSTDRTLNLLYSARHDQAIKSGRSCRRLQ